MACPEIIIAEQDYNEIKIQIQANRTQQQWDLTVV